MTKLKILLFALLLLPCNEKWILTPLKHSHRPVKRRIVVGSPAENRKIERFVLYSNHLNSGPVWYLNGSVVWSSHVHKMF